MAVTKSKFEPANLYSRNHFALATRKRLVGKERSNVARVAGEVGIVPVAPRREPFVSFG